MNIATLQAILVFALFFFIIAPVFHRLRTAQRVDYISGFYLPPGIFERLQKRQPHLSNEDLQLVNEGLRQFFLVYLKSGKLYVSMPSQVVDDLWHEFILYTRQYERFCKKAFGGFLHHTPAVVLKSSQQSNSGLRRCWWYACKEELINPRRPSRLPLLFALDAQLNIENGFHYVADCSSIRRANADGSNNAIIYCCGDFSDRSTDGSLDGFGPDGSGSSHSSSSGDSSNNLGDSSGCSGDSSGCSGGCGGGCGGGGGD